MFLNSVFVFVRVVERKSFKAASAELRMSPSAVSKHVSRLETEMGRQLLRRSTRALVLTDAGAEYFDRARRALDELEVGRSTVMRKDDAMSGTLRIHSPIGVGLRLVSGAVRAFSVAYPDIGVNLSIGPVPTSLNDCGCDLIILHQPVTKETSFESHVAAKVDYYVCASPAYIARAGRPHDPRDLAKHNCIIHEEQALPDEWRFDESEGQRKVKVRGNLRTNNGVIVHDAVVEGLGIGRLPDYGIGQAVRRGQIEILFSNVSEFGRTINIAYPRGRLVTPRVSTFVGFFEEHIRQNRVHGDAAAQ